MTGPSDLEGRARRFWTDSAETYDQSDHGPEHLLALSILSEQIAKHDWRTLLDVGCGTGRALSVLRAHHPELRLTGVDPIQEMLLQAHGQTGLRSFVRADGAHLPFADQTFDVVTEFAVLHHLREPRKMVAEMLRVARFAVFFSDTNRFGNGRYILRPIKLASVRLGVWPLLFWIRTRGRGYYESDGDGISYSYSIFDSIRMCSSWGSTSVVATSPPYHPRPLMGASHALLFAERS